MPWRVRLSEGLAVIPPNATKPVLGKLMVAGDGMDQDAEIRLRVDELEGEVGDKAAPCSGGTGLAVKWERGSELGGWFDLGAEP